MPHNEKVLIEIARAEALVFFEWIKSHEEQLPVGHPAEQTVLWRIEAVLERLLSEPFAPNYNAIVAAARAEVTKSAETSTD